MNKYEYKKIITTSPDELRKQAESLVALGWEYDGATIITTLNINEKVQVLEYDRNDRNRTITTYEQRMKKKSKK